MISLTLSVNYSVISRVHVLARVFFAGICLAVLRRDRRVRGRAYQHRRIYGWINEYESTGNRRDHYFRTFNAFIHFKIRLCEDVQLLINSQT